MVARSPTCPCRFRVPRRHHTQAGSSYLWTVLKRSRVTLELRYGLGLCDRLVLCSVIRNFLGVCRKPLLLSC